MAQRKKSPRRKPQRKPSRKPPVRAASDTMITIDKESVKTVIGLRNLFRRLEILGKKGTLAYDGKGYGDDYQAPCQYPHLVIRRD
jgi:hypothetical protein